MKVFWTGTQKFLIFIIILLQFACGENYSPEEKVYIGEIKQFRIEKDEYMMNDPDSPFNGKKKIEFHPLKYYEPDPGFVFKSKLYEYADKDTIKILGTKGEERKVIRYGFLTIHPHEGEIKINVYKGFSDEGEEYYSIWFTDKTTGEETYGVGRYLDFELSDDKNFIYTIDFNMAYNPYCAYSPEYSCAVPTREDHIPASIEAGEKNFH